MTKQELIDFEKEIGDRFNNREIRAPIHLYDGNEDQIMRVFEKVDKEKDWVCCTWRNHYQALLKGIPKDVLRQEILAGKSMVMNLPQYKFICSSIVGGIPSIATGLALAAKLQGTNEHVWCWTGDMSAQTGAWSEAYRYSVAHDLPITFIVEDNELSVLTPTHEVWGDEHWYLPVAGNRTWYQNQHLIYYQYKNNKYPHAGAGVRVQF
jgi:TPP-dependent pyruvate/acetoin dehydrogenase alpha subunit